MAITTITKTVEICDICENREVTNPAPCILCGNKICFMCDSSNHLYNNQFQLQICKSHNFFELDTFLDRYRKRYFDFENKVKQELIKNSKKFKLEET